MRQQDHDQKERDFDFQQKRAGLSQLVIQGKKQVARIEQFLRDTTTEILVIVREFQKLSDIHRIWYDDIDGFETQTFPVQTQLASAAFYRGGMFASIIAAIIFGVYFSTTTIIADSFWLLFFITTLAAIVFGFIASVVLRDFLHANPVNPGAAKKIRFFLVFFGFAFFVQLAFFAFIRFQTDTPFNAFLPGLMVGLEFTAVLCAACCDVGSRFYSWSEVLHEKHRKLVAKRFELQDELRQETESLERLEARLTAHDSSFPQTGTDNREFGFQPAAGGAPAASGTSVFKDNNFGTNKEVDNDPQFNPAPSPA